MTVSFLFIMFISIIAAIIPINGLTTGNVSDSYTILVLPAKYVFYVVVFIYISILYWLYKQWQMVRKMVNTISGMQTALFSVSMILQIISLYYWHQQQFAISCTFLILATLFFAVFYLLMPATNTWSSRLPITFYLGFLILLIMIQIAINLVHFHWNGFGISQPLWAVILLTFFMAIALHIRFHHYDPYFPIIFIWFFIGTAIENNFEELLVSTAALFLSGVLIAGILFMVKKKRTVY